MRAAGIGGALSKTFFHAEFMQVVLATQSNLHFHVHIWVSFQMGGEIATRPSMNERHVRALAAQLRSKRPDKMQNFLSRSALEFDSRRCYRSLGGNFFNFINFQMAYFKLINLSRLQDLRLNVYVMLRQAIRPVMRSSTTEGPW